jgi:hypothetical protein
MVSSADLRSVLQTFRFTRSEPRTYRNRPPPRITSARLSSQRVICRFCCRTDYHANAILSLKYQFYHFAHSISTNRKSGY